MRQLLPSLGSRAARFATVASTFALLAVAPAQAQQKRVYICPDDHTDYFWTASDTAYRQAFVDMIDFYLDQADATEANPSDFRSRWHCDGSLWMWEYERENPADFPRLIRRLRDGHLSVPLNPLVVMTGASPAEAILRGMYYPGRIERREDLRFRMAISMENQGFPCGLPSLWAGSGATISWKGVCGCVTEVPELTNRDHEIYRAQGPDGSGVLLKWHSLTDNQNIGGYAEARFPAAVVDYVTVNAPFNGFQARYPFDVIGAFGKGWDDFQTFTTEFVSVAQTSSNASRRVIVSNALDFFADFIATYGAGGQATVTQSFGNEWDVDAASFAEQSARMKRATERLRSAEALASIAVLFDPAFMSGREAARDEAFMGMGTFYEHNMGMQFPQTGAEGIALRLAWQRRLADNAENYASGLLSDARTRLGDLVTPAPGQTRFVVFNPLSWTRDDAADLPWSDTAPVRVIDVQTSAEVPSQIIPASGSNPRRLRIWASAVPSMGYRTYRIETGPGQAFTPAASVTGAPGASATIENARYRVTLQGRGAVTSLRDLSRSSREFAASVGGRAINDLGPSSGSVIVENSGPVSVTLLASAASPVAHTTRLTLYRAGERLELHNQITQNFNATQEWSWGFSLASPRLIHEEIGAIIRAALTTQGGDYSPRNARYDILTLNHFADLAEPAANGVGVTLSNADCLFMRRGNSTTTSLDTTTPRLNVLAGGRLIFANGIENQAGDSLFTQRFALRTHALQDQVAAMRFALEHQNPLVATLVSGGTPRLPADSFSLLSVSNPSVLAWALKPAEDGPGAEGGPLTLRLWNLSTTAQNATIQLAPRAVRAALASTHIETIDPAIGPAPSISAAGATASFNTQQIRTFRLALACPGDADNDGDADFDDLTSVLGNFGAMGVAYAPGDANGSGGVTFDDVTSVLASFGSVCR